MPDQIAPLLDEALRNRPELATLRLEENAAQRFAQAEHDLYYPTISVAGTAGFVPTGQVQIPGRYGAVGRECHRSRSSTAGCSRPGRRKRN